MFLLDTCVLLWLVMEQEKLSEKAKSTLDRVEEVVFVSAISALEIGLKVQKGKLELPLSVAAWFSESLKLHGLKELPVTSSIAAESALLPAVHRDPFDRILVATARLHNLTIITPDDQIRAYPETRYLW